MSNKIVTACTREYASEVRAAEEEYTQTVEAARQKLQAAQGAAFARYEARSHLLSIQLPKSWTALLAKFAQVMVEKEPLENRFRLNGYLRPDRPPELTSDIRDIVDPVAFNDATRELWDAFKEFRTRGPGEPTNAVSLDITHDLPDCSAQGFQIQGVRLFLKQIKEGGLIADAAVHVWTPALQAANDRDREAFLADVSSLASTRPPGERAN
jgi:hypothetical protein